MAATLMRSLRPASSGLPGETESAHSARVGSRLRSRSNPLPVPFQKQPVLDSNRQVRFVLGCEQRVLRHVLQGYHETKFSATAEDPRARLSDSTKLGDQ